MQHNSDSRSIYNETYHVTFPSAALKNLVITTVLVATAFLLSGSFVVHNPVNDIQAHTQKDQSIHPHAWLDLVHQQLQSTALEYPVEARRHAIEGVCTVRFTVTETGQVEDAKVLKQCDNAAFEQPVLEALQRNTLPPRYLNGKPTKVIGVTNRFEFILNSNTF